MSAPLTQGLTFAAGQQALPVAPLQVENVEADEVLQVHQHDHQRVELVGQPEVCKLHAVERSGEHPELDMGRGGGGEKEA